MSFSVNVLLPNGRRRNLKVSPNNTISQTLESLCKKENLDFEEFAFLFQRKILDEGLSWRHANVPNNVKLELVKHEKSKVETPVRIALQFNDGQRLQGTFQPSQSLAEILNHWKNELSTLTHPENYEPSILYVRQEVTGHRKLITTTLKSLGLTSGSAILRLSHKPVTADMEAERKLEKVKPSESASLTTTPKPPIKIHPSDAAKPVSIPKRGPFMTPPTPQATPTDPVSSRSQKAKNAGFITEEMLSTALQQVSDTDISQKAPTSSDSVESMDISIASTSGSNVSNDIDGSTMDDNILKNGRVRQSGPNSLEMPRKKVRQNQLLQEQPETVTDFTNFKFPEETAGMDIYEQDDDSAITIAPLMKPCKREEIFFDEKEVEDVDAEDPGDEFFDLTIDDIRRMIAELRSLQNESEDQPLLTKRSQELERLRAINQYPKIIIRVAFPNRKILQGLFRPAEKVEALYDFVSQFVSAPKSDFFLFTTPPKVILKDKNAILYDFHLSPASKVYFGLKDGDFDPSLFSKNCDAISGSASDANLSLREVFEMKTPSEQKSQPSLDLSSERAMASTSSGSENRPIQSQQPTNHPSGARRKTPKWFKIGKN